MKITNYLSSTSEKIYYAVFDLAILFLLTMILAVSAQIKINFIFTPVPITAQTLFVLLFSYFLGSKKAVSLMLLYIYEGIIGMPVFANGSFGLSYLFGPTGGYLLGFIFAAYFIGYASEKGLFKDAISMFLLFIIGNLIIYVFGLLHLSLFVGYNNVLKAGFYPFIVGDMLKICLATISIKSLKIDYRK